MKNLKNLFLAAVAILGSAVSALAGNVPEYQLQGAGVGNQGTYVVTVTVLGKKNNINDDVLGRCAVHGVLFKGFSDAESRKTYKPLAGSAANEGQHAEFYEDFFADGGAANNYVQFVNSSRKVVKAGKQYKISVTATINKDQLRSDLEKAGVIRSLNAIF